MDNKNIDDLLNKPHKELLEMIRSESSGSYEDEKESKRVLYTNIITVKLSQETGKLNKRIYFLNVVLVILTIILVVLTLALLPK